KFPEDQAALWNGLVHGGLSTLATDEYPTSLALKLRGKTIEDVTGGNVGAEARMGIGFTEGVGKRGMSLERYVDITATNAGKLLEELAVGQVFQHQPGRTVTEADNVLFSCLTMNPQPLHVDFHAAAKAEFGKPLVNSLFTLGVAVGLSVGETTLGTTVGNLGFEKVEFP